MLGKIVKKPGKYVPQLFMTMIASMGYFCIGNIRGWSSSGIPSLNATIHAAGNRPNWDRYFEMTDNDLNWISSLPPLCSLFGSLMISFPLTYLGRKKSLMALTVFGIVGFLLMGFTVYARHKSVIYIGRILTGFLVGAATPASQIYVSECASRGVRGILGSFTASFLALGIFVTYIIGAFVNWYQLAWICSTFPMVLLIGMIFLPETPSWLLANDRESDARSSLQRLRGKKTNVENELLRMKDSLEKSRMNGASQDISAEELLRGSVWKPLGISMGIMFFQQFTGINAVVYYTVSIFNAAGSSIQPRYAAIIVGFVQLLFTVGSGFFVDRFGRRALLLGSGLIVTVSVASMASFFHLQRRWGEGEATETIGWLPLVSLMVFFAAYSSGFANVPFIIMGELFPSRYRSILGPITSSFGLLCTFTVVYTFPIMMRSRMGSAGPFWLFTSSTIIGLLFIFFFLPETKGKSLEDIERLFSAKVAPKESSDGPTVDAVADELPSAENHEELDIRPIEITEEVSDHPITKEE